MSHRMKFHTQDFANQLEKAHRAVHEVADASLELGKAQERERIIALMYQQLAYYNKLLINPKSPAFAKTIETRKQGIIESIKLAQMTRLQADEVFRKKGENE